TIPPPLPSKKQPKKAQAPISVEDTFGIENFLFSSLPDTLTSEQVSQSIEKISNNVNRQDLKNYLSRNNFENVNKHNYPIAVALALALARHDEEERNGIYLCHKRNAAGFIGDYYRFDQKLYGDLGSNATEFVICVSYGALKEKDKELFNKSIRILATPLLIVAFYEELEEEDQQTFIDLLNDENKALLRS
ncbi:MAG TPA: hypothetical protein PLO43_02965, partial [Chlamydiales bacterium]|nr:hypothetical protein [Chlamydiales bacterium]